MIRASRRSARQHRQRQQRYGGIIIDQRDTGRTATFFVVTPRNIQYDAITDDASGEDSSPDFFWESASDETRRKS